MTYVRVFAGMNGESPMEDVPVAMMPTEVFPGLPLLAVAPPILTTALILVRFPRRRVPRVGGVHRGAR